MHRFQLLQIIRWSSADCIELHHAMCNKMSTSDKIKLIKINA